MNFIGLLRMRNSKKTAKTGVVKKRTMRSPIGRRGHDGRHVRLTEAWSTP